MNSRTIRILSLILCLGTLAAGVPGQKAKQTAIALRVTIEATDSSSAACKICSDGGGEYIDGVDGVKAVLGDGGGLVVNFQDSLTAQVRSVNFDYSDPLPPNTTVVPPLTEPVIQKIVTGFPQTVWTAMELGQSQCLGLDWRFTDPNISVRSVAFQYGPVRAGTSYSVITCTAVDGAGKCAEWEIEPKGDGACNPAGAEPIAVVSSVTSARGRITYTPYGLYRMPYKLTLRKK